MALDFGETARQLQSAVGGAARTARTRRQRFADTLDRALAVSAGDAAERTASAGRRPFALARTGGEGLLGSIPPPDAPADWTALSVDGSHIDVDRHLPLRCYLVNLGGCIITYGKDYGCQVFSEPTLAAGDADLYLRPSDADDVNDDRNANAINDDRNARAINDDRNAYAVDDAHNVHAISDARNALAVSHAGDAHDYDVNAASDDRYAHAETPISGPLLGALRTVREVERLADAVDGLPPGLPVLALLDGTLAFWDLQRGNYPRYVSEILIGKRLRNALARLRDASRSGRPVAVAAYTSRPQTTEAAGAVRTALCGQSDAECTRRCSARRSDLMQCDAAAGFDDRELFGAILEPGHRSPLYQSGRLASRFAVGLAVGEEWSRFYYMHSGTEIARVEIPDWAADDPHLLDIGHAMLVRQCTLGLGYPAVIAEAHEQAVVTGRDREEFRRLALRLLEGEGLPAPESAKTVSKRLPWV